MMKYCIAILLLSISNLSNAQIKRNSILLGGQLSYFNDRNQSENSTQNYESGRIGISIGKAIKENSVVGINFTYTPNKQENMHSGLDSFTTKSNRYEIGGFYREYKNIGKEFYFFGQVDGAYITGNQKEDYTGNSKDVTITQNGGFASLTIGLSYNIFKKMQVELSIPNLISMQYLVSNSDSENPQVPDADRKQFSFSSNLTNSSILGYLGVGFRFIL